MVLKIEKEKVTEIMGNTDCPHKFRCVNSGLEKLCKANDMGLDEYLECLEDDPLQCPFAISFGYGFLCKCPMRIYIAKELHK